MAGIKSFVKQIDPENQNITQTQSNVNSSVKQIANSPIIDGVIVENIDVGTGDTVVNHELGRAPVGWIVVRKNEAGEVYEFKNKKRAEKFAAGSWKQGKAKREAMKEYRKSKRNK